MSTEGGRSALANADPSGVSKQSSAAGAESQRGGGNTQGGAAPNYVQPVLGATQASKPKGKNLTEGGFDDNPAHNASFNAEIGTKNDPGRAAEGLFGSRAAQNPEQSAGAVHRGTGMAGEAARQTGQPYGALGSEQEA